MLYRPDLLDGFIVLGDPGQLGRAQHVRGVGDGAVRVGGEGGQDLDPAVLRVAFQEPGPAVVFEVDGGDDADQGPARRGD
ncbi:hypothetical protein OG426_55000 (plasmid) [Streptomyces canus]|uniref:hypothetical protein n=1 Tax=Streptomyces canus TaxID=58343 RepID=UPI002F916387|nr:hypothetical protein OG426_55000 [Streptomyces canus]